MLSFVPPDGRFKLFGYEMAEPSGPTKRLELPLNLKTKMSLNSNGGEWIKPKKQPKVLESNSSDFQVTSSSH